MSTEKSYEKHSLPRETRRSLTTSDRVKVRAGTGRGCVSAVASRIGTLLSATPALLLALAISASAAAQATGNVKTTGGVPWKRIRTRYQVAGDFPFRTPTERMAPVGRSLSLPSDITFSTSPGVSKLGVDTTGNGRPDKSASGHHDTIQLLLKYADGTRQPYSIYLTHVGARWSYRRHCYRYAMFKNTPIFLIDDNHDGYYDGYGADAMVVGRNRYASFLSQVVSIRGKLYQFKTNRPGTYVYLRPYTGKSGTLDLGRQFRARGRLGAAVVKSGSLSFDAARATIVPVGIYTFTWGAVWKGKSWVRVSASTPLQVTEGQTTYLAWGAPFKIDFSVSRRGKQVTVSPSSLRVLGRVGERYHNFYPQALTPGVRIRCRRTHKRLSAGTMVLGWFGFRPPYIGRVRNASSPIQVFLYENQYSRLLAKLFSDWQDY